MPPISNVAVRCFALKVEGSTPRASASSMRAAIILMLALDIFWMRGSVSHPRGEAGFLGEAGLVTNFLSVDVNVDDHLC
jgi:hypothetical protein